MNNRIIKYLSREDKLQRRVYMEGKQYPSLKLPFNLNEPIDFTQGGKINHTNCNCHLLPPDWFFKALGGEEGGE